MTLSSIISTNISENAINQATLRYYVFYGTYESPEKALTTPASGESEEVYQFLICAISPLVGEYEMGTPEAGFLYPAFEGRCAETGKIYVLE